MKKYLGVKVISAEPMYVKEYNEKYNKTVPEDKGDGYTVVYEEGYRSWSPKDVFEKAYREVESMTFGLAIEAMKKGYVVSRIHGKLSDIILFKGRFVSLSSPKSELIFKDEDVLAEDWCMVASIK